MITYDNQKRAMLLIKRSVWNLGNDKKKGSWEQATVGLMLFRCDYAGITIIIIWAVLWSDFEDVGKDFCLWYERN